MRTLFLRIDLRRRSDQACSYFRQLQEISDTVAEVEWDGSVTRAIMVNNAIQASIDEHIQTGRARARYVSRSILISLCLADGCAACKSLEQGS